MKKIDKFFSFDTRINKYVCIKSFSVYLPDLPENFKYSGENFNVDNRNLQILYGFTFDGCSCSPDFEKALKGCCVHGALYIIVRGGLLAREIADKCLLFIHKQEGFSLRYVYYYAVKWFGWQAGKCSKKNLRNKFIT